MYQQQIAKRVNDLPDKVQENSEGEGTWKVENIALSDDEYHHLALLYREQSGALTRYLTRMLGSQDDAAEILQESFCKLLRHAKENKLEGVVNTYLYKTATNLAKDHFRRRRVRHADMHVSLDNVEDISDHSCLESKIIWGQELNAVKDGLKSMPRKMRDVFVLSRFEGYKNAEIARLLNITTRTVERRMNKALDFLVEKIERVK